MKLKHKVLLLVLGVLLGSFSVCGFFSVSRLQAYSLSILVESEKEKLEITGHALRQAGTREDFEQMGEIARDAYLKYQFKRCYRQGYALLKDGTCLVNLTDYEIVNPGALKGEYMVQELKRAGSVPAGETLQLLLVKRPLEYPEGFEVMAVKDITPAWRMLRQQMYLLAAVFGLLTMAAAAVVFLSIRYLLRGLEELRLAAADISDGKLGRLVTIHSRDEVGEVGKAFNRMSKQVERQVEDLQLLLGALAHEMKTPVTSIMGYADSLLHVRLPERQQEAALQNIYDSGRRMEHMASKLLSLIGLYENGAVEHREISIAGLLELVREETREIFAEKRVKLSLLCEENFFVTGDELLLKSLFSNLAVNGCRAEKPGGEVRIMGGKNVVTVSDGGCGIPEKDLPYVTKPFYMADKSRSRSEGGSGLGLALGKRIADLHHASMEIESRPGEGTVVTIRFLENPAK